LTQIIINEQRTLISLRSCSTARRLKLFTSRTLSTALNIFLSCMVPYAPNSKGMGRPLNCSLSRVKVGNALDQGLMFVFCGQQKYSARAQTEKERMKLDQIGWSFPCLGDPSHSGLGRHAPLDSYRNECTRQVYRAECAGEQTDSFLLCYQITWYSSTVNMLKKNLADLFSCGFTRWFLACRTVISAIPCRAILFYDCRQKALFFLLLLRELKFSVDPWSSLKSLQISSIVDFFGADVYGWGYKHIKPLKTVKFQIIYGCSVINHLHDIVRAVIYFYELEKSSALNHGAILMIMLSSCHFHYTNLYYIVGFIHSI
jgi:hypothetical protein